MSPNHTLLGFAAAALGFLVLPFGDAFGKLLAVDGISPFQIAWGRWLLSWALMTPIVLMVHGWRALRPQDARKQVARAAGLVCATVFFFGSLAYIPLANATAVLFIAPLMVTAMSAIFLKERVGPRRWVAVLIGLAAVMLIVKPGMDGFHWASFLVLGAATGFATYLVMTRYISNDAPPIVGIWWMGLTGFIAMSIVVTPFWSPLQTAHWGYFMGIGVSMTLGHLLVIWAAVRLQASAMAPMPYLEMVTSTALGVLVFGDFPDALTWIGCAAVMGCGLFVAWRERLAEVPEDIEESVRR